MIPPIIEPRIYRLKQDKKKLHYLEPADYSFEVPDKIYGNTNHYVEIFWNTYTKKVGSTGVMLTGSAGSGKSLLAMLLSNKAIRSGVPVVLVSEIQPNIDTIYYLGRLKNMVIMMDEYSKNFNNGYQAKMLTMLAGVDSPKKLFIITENRVDTISNYIRNRPGRIRYHIDYDRTEESVILEYCADHNVDSGFLSELLEKYHSVMVFSFDHLQAIVSEHLMYPNLSFETILSVLNLEALKKPAVIRLVEVKLKSTDTVLPSNISREINKKTFNNGAQIYIDFERKRDGFGQSGDSEENKDDPFKDVADYGISVTKGDVIEVTDNKLKCLVKDKYEVYLEYN